MTIPSKPDPSAWFAIDRTVAPEHIDWAKPQTANDLREALEAGIKAMRNYVPEPPCGFDKAHAHLISPHAKTGGITRCVQCGDLLVKVSETHGRPAQLEDFPEGTSLGEVMALSVVSKGFGR